MPDLKLERCGSCRNWKPLQGMNTTGSCLRDSPRGTEITDIADYCGKFRVTEAWTMYGGEIEADKLLRNKVES